MSNLSILQRNMLSTMSEEAQALYLRGCERDEWAACQAGWDWDIVSTVLDPMFNAVMAIHGCPDHGVREFVKERVYRRRIPDGRRS